MERSERTETAEAAEAESVLLDGANQRPLVDDPKLSCGGPFFSLDDQWVLYRASPVGSHVMHVFMTSVDGIVVSTTPPSPVATSAVAMRERAE